MRGVPPKQQQQIEGEMVGGRGDEEVLEVSRHYGSCDCRPCVLVGAEPPPQVRAVVDVGCPYLPHQLAGHTGDPQVEGQGQPCAVAGQSQPAHHTGCDGRQSHLDRGRG